jgi:hypothetical protein
MSPGDGIWMKTFQGSLSGLGSDPSREGEIIEQRLNRSSDALDIERVTE